MGLRLKMKDRLEEAIEKAKEVDSWAELVNIVGICVDRDGAIEFGKENDYISRWNYSFVCDRGKDKPPKFVTVLYWQDGEKAHVDDNAGNVSDTEPFPEETITSLKNSDELVSHFNRKPEHTPLSGEQNDIISYRMEKMMMPVSIVQNWKGQSIMVDPVNLESLI